LRLRYESLSSRRLTLRFAVDAVRTIMRPVRRPQAAHARPSLDSLSDLRLSVLQIVLQFTAQDQDRSAQEAATVSSVRARIGGRESTIRSVFDATGVYPCLCAFSSATLFACVTNSADPGKRDHHARNRQDQVPVLRECVCGSNRLLSLLRCPAAVKAPPLVRPWTRGPSGCRCSPGVMSWEKGRGPHREGPAVPGTAASQF